MEQFFLAIYRFFKIRRSLFWILLSLVALILILGASRIKLEEDITRFFPNDKRVEKLSYVFQNAKFAERLVVMISVKDSATVPIPDSLVSLAERLSQSIENNLKPYVKSVTSRLESDKIMEVFNQVQTNLPVFLDNNDYHYLDSITQPAVAKEVLNQNYRQLISPAGVAVKNIIIKDPLGFSFLVLKKLQRLQYDENFELYENYIITRDHRHLIFFIQPQYPPNETGHNAQFIDQLNTIVKKESASHEELITSYFGATAVAVGNAKQLQRDTLLTVCIMLLLLMVVLLGYFKRKRTPFLLLTPVVFGALLSLCCIAIIQQSLSVLSLAVGAVILGIAVDYSLHYLVHLKHYKDAEHVIKELAKPLTIGSVTTVLAFFCLQFANASVLRDIGLFAGFSLIGAAFCSLVILPHLIHEKAFINQKPNWVDKLSSFSFETNKFIVYIILILTPVFFYYAQFVKFNSDMSKLNFMKEETQEAQARLELINKSSLGSIYVTSSGHTLEEALQKNERVIPILDSLVTTQLINKYASVSSFLISDSLQKSRIQKWNSFWTNERKERVLAIVHEEGANLKFSDRILNNFDTLLSKTYYGISDEIRSSIQSTFFDDYIIEKNELATIITLANVPPENKDEVYKHLEGSASQSFDRQMLTNLLVEYVNEDFNFIVTFTSVLVFVALLISYGRIELTLITFVPMLFTWIWILGIMALIGIEFNIVNVMVSTFIFGLGDDYSIFIMDGLQQEYRAGKKALPSIRTSIFLSAVTTVCGLGVLIFAEHPALKSIAAISIIGIVCVYIMAQTIEPFFFRLLISNRTKRGLPPVTLRTFCWTVFTYSFFALGSVSLTVVGLLLKLIPFKRSSIRLFYHILISGFTRALVFSGLHVRKIILNDARNTFESPSVIISNHTSFMDILVTIMLHPKLILLTNKWVWNSPVFGGVVRLADYYPVMEGAEDSADRLRDRVKEGYSIVVFPEGTRSADGKIKRFHKGAFYMAETLQIPIQPLLIHGAGDVIAKGDMLLNDGTITLKFLPAIKPDNLQYGTTYAERTKNVSRYFKEKHRELVLAQQTPSYFKYKLFTNYLYKGPVLEWYMRVKVHLEKNYETFHTLVPQKATVLDLGCGYGFLCYMLHFLSDERIITGVDYDEEKIETANHCYSKNEKLQFIQANILNFDFAQYDVIIMADVLHYLMPEAQDILLLKCFNALRSGGKLILREGNADFKERHQGTKLTEFFSVKLLKFNKSTNDLNFISGNRLKELTEQSGLTFQMVDDARLTSNVIFIIQKP